MKGLILSCATLLFLVILTIVSAQILRPKQHAKLFFMLCIPCAALYFLAYELTPATLGFLPLPWQAKPSRLDAIFGCVVFLLNSLTYINLFGALNTGFSTSLMLDILQTGKDGMTTEQIVAGYAGDDGIDKIHGWRLPGLERSGYLRKNGATGIYRLTAKGFIVAHLSSFFKILLRVNVESEDK